MTWVTPVNPRRSDTEHRQPLLDFTMEACFNLRNQTVLVQSIVKDETAKSVCFGSATKFNAVHIKHRQQFS